MKRDSVIDKKLLKNIDVGIIISVILLFVAGLLAISSATGVAHGGSLRYVNIESVAFVLGIIAMVITLFFDYNTFWRNE